MVKICRTVGVGTSRIRAKERWLIGSDDVEFDDLITQKVPPANRVGKADGPHEHLLPEGAVMVAYAMHLLHSGEAKSIEIHPDGEHGKRFDFSGWLARRGFSMISSTGTTSYGGTYRNDKDWIIVLDPKPGLGDVVAGAGQRQLLAECKGGIINTRHSGQVSQLCAGLCETVGRLMGKPSAGRQVAVVPYTNATLRLAQRLAPRCKSAGIEIVLVKSRGEVITIQTAD